METKIEILESVIRKFQDKYCEELAHKEDYSEEIFSADDFIDVVEKMIKEAKNGN